MSSVISRQSSAISRHWTLHPGTLHPVSVLTIVSPRVAEISHVGPHVRVGNPLLINRVQTGIQERPTSTDDWQKTGRKRRHKSAESCRRLQVGKTRKTREMPRKTGF